MKAETAKSFEALEAQAQRIMGVFAGAGYEAVAPAMIQPADVFLEVVGEALRARTYVFTAPDGSELCLRPDLTVPTCLLHLERIASKAAASAGPARYCYNGAAFRFQPAGVTAAHPREFRQAGIELYGERNREAADIEVLRLTLEALRAAGLASWKIRIGDIGLVHALIGALEMPERWRARLRHFFWRPEAFRAELRRMMAPADALPAGEAGAFALSLDPADPKAAEARVAEVLDAGGVEVFGARSLAEVTQSLLARAADARSEPLAPERVRIIEDYLALSGPARAVGARLKDLARSSVPQIAAAVDTYHQRLQQMAAAGIDIANLEFSADFGRSFEYYTGFVFEVVAPKLGAQSPIAGGGRYDGLMTTLGAREPVPAVGVAIHTERLLTLVAESAP